MRIIILAFAAVLVLPSAGMAQTYATTGSNNRTGISGDIPGNLGKQKQYYYKRNVPDRPGCYRSRNGNYICK